MSQTVTKTTTRTITVEYDEQGRLVREVTLTEETTLVEEPS